VKRGIPVDVATRVVDRFVEVGLIDDAEYARLWAASRHRTKGSARSVLRQELRAKGVDDASVTEALEQIDGDSEWDRARRLVAVRARSLGRFDDATRQRRLVSLLMRRGYSQSVALGVVREVMGEQAEEIEPLG
jgi:regulatory protein